MNEPTIVTTTCSCVSLWLPRDISIAAVASTRWLPCTTGFTSTCRRYCFLHLCREKGDFESALEAGRDGSGMGKKKGGYSATIEDVLALCGEDWRLILCAFVALLLAATSQVGGGEKGLCFRGEFSALQTSFGCAPPPPQPLRVVLLLRCCCCRRYALFLLSRPPVYSVWLRLVIDGLPTFSALHLFPPPVSRCFKSRPQAFFSISASFCIPSSKHADFSRAPAETQVLIPHFTGNMIDNVVERGDSRDFHRSTVYLVLAALACATFSGIR